VVNFAGVPRLVQDTEDWYEQDDFWHPELTKTADVDFFMRWDFWSWMVAGASANYGARPFAADPYSQTGTDTYVEPIPPYTDFTGQRLTGLDSLPFLVSYFQDRGIDLSLFTAHNSLVTWWSMGTGTNWHPNLMQGGTDEFLVYDPNAGQQGAYAHLDGGRTASLTLDLTSAPGTYQVEWYRPTDGAAQGGDPISGGGPVTLTAPWTGTDVVLRLLVMPETVPGSLTGRTATASVENLLLTWPALSGATRWNTDQSTPFPMGVTAPLVNDTSATSGTTHDDAVNRGGPSRPTSSSGKAAGSGGLVIDADGGAADSFVVETDVLGGNTVTQTCC
jgi:hypothetical protein